MPVRVVAGPARSGKTATLLQRYRRVLAQQPIGSTLWLAPTSRRPPKFAHGCSTIRWPAAFDPVCLPSSNLPDIVASRTNALRFVGQLLKRQVLQRVVVGLDRAGQLQYFAPIANKAGLVDLLAGLMSDLKRQEVWPDEFRRSVELVGPSEKNREIAAVYDQYQQLLNDHRLYDSEGRFWSARMRCGQTLGRSVGPIRNAPPCRGRRFYRFHPHAARNFAAAGGENAAGRGADDQFARRT